MSTEKARQIQAIASSIQNMAFEDIERAIAGKSLMGAFILGSCFIDCLASFHAGGNTSQTHFKDVVAKFLPAYNPDKLYKDLRCKLVHNYSEGGSYMFVDGHPELHLKRFGGRAEIFINLEDFVADLKQAMETYLHLLNTDEATYVNAVRKATTVGLLGVAHGEFVLTSGDVLYQVPEA